MNTNNSPIDIDGRTSQSKLKSPQFMKFVQIVSRIVTLIFIVALGWTIFEAAVNGNSLPLWAWLGLLTLLAAGISLALVRLRVESGVGELKVDLSGERDRSMEAFIKAGIGDTSLRLPQSVGVRVQSAVSFGSIKANGLTWDGQVYTNDRYGHTAVTLDITIEGGMGKVSLEQTG